MKDLHDTLFPWVSKKNQNQSGWKRHMWIIKNSAFFSCVAVSFDHFLLHALKSGADDPCVSGSTLTSAPSHQLGFSPYSFNNPQHRCPRWPCIFMTPPSCYRSSLHHHHCEAHNRTYLARSAKRRQQARREHVPEPNFCSQGDQQWREQWHVQTD